MQPTQTIPDSIELLRVLMRWFRTSEPTGKIGMTSSVPTSQRNALPDALVTRRSCAVDTGRKQTVEGILPREVGLGKTPSLAVISDLSNPWLDCLSKVS